MSGPFSAPGAKLTLAISLAMSVLGITGVANGVAFLRAQPEQDVVQPDVPPEAAEAAGELANMVIGSPALKASAVGNLLASALLVLASFLLTARRPSALWWAQQALVANVLYTLGSVGATLWFLQSNADQIGDIMQRVAAAQSAEGGEAAASTQSPSALALASVLACVGALTLGVYLLLLKGIRREDVRSFVEAEKVR